MHIPDGCVAGPINLVTALVSTGACGVAAARAHRALDDRHIPLLGVTAAFIFAAQMINFPVAGGTSGHFLGAALAGILLGPANCCLIFAVVLSIQCLGFADGGLTALGSNFFNMGLVGGLSGYLIFKALHGLLPKSRKSFLAAAAVASWSSVVLAALACAAELALSGQASWFVALSAIGGWHALIGVGEALITTSVLSTILASRPDLVGVRALQAA